MKTLIQKLPVAEQTSFVARTYTTPLFETSWHQHVEYELILQLQGKGLCFIGNYIGDFTAGDVFFLGSNLPHQFKKQNEEMVCSVMVIHFDKNFWGKDFLEMPESREIKNLLHQSQLAIKLNRHHPALAAHLQQLEKAQGFERIALLCQCLLLISREPDKQTLSTISSKELTSLADDKINKLFAYTIEHFKEPIALQTAASIANMSISAFCRYFKRNTKKTYIEFVNEMRIGHACQALLHTDKTVANICYDSGFATIANFNKQFLKVKGITPSAYKKKSRI